MNAITKKLVKTIASYESLEVFASGVFQAECLISPQGILFFPATQTYGDDEDKQILISAIEAKQAVIDARQARIDEGEDGRITFNKMCNSLKKAFEKDAVKMGRDEFLTRFDRGMSSIA